METVRRTPHRDRLLSVLPLAAVSLFALTVHTIFLELLPSRWAQNESVDYFSFYEPVARNLVEGKGLVTSDGRPAVLYPPGYPLILAGLLTVAQDSHVPEAMVNRIFTALTVIATALLIYGIALLIFEKSVAVIASLVWSAYPFHLWLTKQENSEISFLVLFFLAIYIFLRALGAHRSRGWLSLCAGLLVGFASLVRPIALLLGGTFLLTLWISKLRWTSRQRLILSGLLILGNVLPLVPWEIWVHQRIGRWIPLSTNGPSSISDGLRMGARTDTNIPPVPSDVREVIGEVNARISQLQSNKAIYEFLVEKSSQHPSTILKLLGLKAARAWYATDSQRLEKWVALIQLPYLVFALFGFMISVRSDSSKRSFSLLVILITLYFWIMTIIALSILRYMIPVMGLLIISVAVSLVTVGRGWGRWGPAEEE